MAAEVMESFYAVRRTDGETIGDYTWMGADGPNDWDQIEGDYEDAWGEPIEYEIVLMVPIVVARRSFPETEVDEIIEQIVEEVEDACDGDH